MANFNSVDGSANLYDNAKGDKKVLEQIVGAFESITGAAIEELYKRDMITIEDINNMIVNENLSDRDIDFLIAREILTIEDLKEMAVKEEIPDKYNEYLMRKGIIDKESGEVQYAEEMKYIESMKQFNNSEKPEISQDDDGR